MTREKQTTVEVVCPKCRNTKIITLPREELPCCAQCKVRMMINEILTEGKSY